MRLTGEGDPAALPEGEAVSASPEVRRVAGLLSAAECEYLRAIAEPLYQPSIVNDGRGFMVRDPIRTSDGATLHWLIEDPALHAINRRLAAASGSRAEQGEAIQILRYRPGQEYRPHLDAARITDNPRLLTALVWLNADYQGGETRFLDPGLEVKGEAGDALVFRNLLADGRTPDLGSRHAGLPVTSGAKYLASRWIRRERWVP
jgi:prolyl 4-hydroxylase